MRRSAWVIIVVVVAVVILHAHGQGHGYARLELDYYEESCPRVEQVVKAAVYSRFKTDNRITGALLRLQFHDCFVQGCDASILLDSSPDGSTVEKEAVQNKNSLRGYDVIDSAKEELEAECKGTVSCADIIALAARDSVVLSGGPYYEVALGRLDGRISSKVEAERDLPGPNFTVAQLKDSFLKKHLNTEDLVSLSGGHSIGRSQCAFFNDRIYNFNNTGRPDPSLSENYRSVLQALCPNGANPSPRVELDRNSGSKFDNKYYANLLESHGLLGSDQVLSQDAATKKLVSSYAASDERFRFRFTRSMVKMGEVGLKSRADGEVRLKCNVVNSAIHKPSDAHADAEADDELGCMDTDKDDSKMCILKPRQSHHHG